MNGKYIYIIRHDPFLSISISITSISLIESNNTLWIHEHVMTFLCFLSFYLLTRVQSYNELQEENIFDNFIMILLVYLTLLIYHTPKHIFFLIKINYWWSWWLLYINNMIKKIIYMKHILRIFFYKNKKSKHGPTIINK